MIEPIGFRWEFTLLRASGRYRRSGPVGLRYLDAEASDDPIGGARVAYAVGRRVGGAVVRNRVRRRLRELVAAVDRQSSLRPGRYLFIASPSASSMTSSELAPHVHALVEWSR